MKIENNMDFVDIFEEKLCQYTGFNYAICIDCCTNGILISLEMLQRCKKIHKDVELNISQWTYMSVPMTLKNNGWKVNLVDDRWSKFYQIGNTKVFDAATDFHRNMVKDYDDDSIVCISFQQKKRLPLGRGGAILLNSLKYAQILKRLRYDGRNEHISDSIEIRNDPNCIICGYHCYMEPDKAAKGILILNQEQFLKPYVQHSWNEYENLSSLKCLLDA